MTTPQLIYIGRLHNAQTGQERARSCMVDDKAREFAQRFGHHQAPPPPYFLFLPLLPAICRAITPQQIRYVGWQSPALTTP